MAQDRKFTDIRRHWRGIVRDTIRKNNYLNVRYGKSKDPYHPRLCVIASRMRYHSDLEDGREYGGLKTGRCDLVVNARGYASGMNFRLGYPGEFKEPILVNAGEDLDCLGDFFGLKKEINKIGESYRKGFPEKTEDFLRDVVESCDHYMRRIAVPNIAVAYFSGSEEKSIDTVLQSEAV